MNTNLSSLVATFESLREQHEGLVLASIVETIGSTYRKAGAHMLITPNADYFGLLGGGCFEADLLAHAQSLFEDKKSKTVFYDMRAPEDEIWGLGLGCNGAVRIYLQYISADQDEHIISLLEQCLAKKQRSVVLTVCESSFEALEPNTHLLLEFEDDGPANLPTDTPDELIQAATRAFISGTSTWLDYQDDDVLARAFFNVITPPFHLMIIGAGPDAQPIVSFAKQLGWNITLVDYRESFLEQQAFSIVDQKLLLTPEELTGNAELTNIDALVLMTHKIEYDERYLKQLIHTSAPYIGLLGPAARRDRLLTSIGDDAEKIADRVFGPVGLDIGGELPEEIALSLVAEIQATLYSKDGGSLHTKTTPLHSPQDFNIDNLHAIVLAAGGATRFGGLKQLIEYKGESLLRRCISSAQDLVEDRIWVVLGARSQKVKRNIENLGIHLLFNDNWEKGMASSLQTGLESIPAECSGILLMLCDQALIETEHLRKLSNTWQNDKTKIVVSQYSDTHGVPAILPRKLFPEIQNLRGDSGAKSLFSQHKDILVAVDIPQAETDIDTQEDYMKLLSE